MSEPSTEIDAQAEEVDGQVEPVGGETAAEKILATLRALSQPRPDAGEWELTIATVCMGLERSLGPQLAEQQATGEIDEFVLDLTRFLATHRSDSAQQLLVVEMPRRPNLPAGTRLHLMDEAARAAENAVSPL
jgi:hypothetical protein